MLETGNFMVIPGNQQLVNPTFGERAKDLFWYYRRKCESYFNQGSDSHVSNPDDYTDIRTYHEMYDGSRVAFLSTVKNPAEKEPSKANQASVEEIPKPEPVLASKEEIPKPEPVSSSYEDNLAMAIQASKEEIPKPEPVSSSYEDNLAKAIQASLQLQRKDVPLRDLISNKVMNDGNQVDLGTGEGRNLCWAFCLTKCPAFRFLLNMTQDDLKNLYGFIPGEPQDIVQAARAIVEKTPEKFKDFKLEILIRQPDNVSWACGAVTAPDCEMIKSDRLFLQITGDQHSAHYTCFNEKIYLEPSVIVRF